MKQRISRAKLAEVVRNYDSRQTGARRSGIKSPSSFLLLNNSAQTLAAGTAVRLTGFSSACSTYAKANEAYLNNRATFVGSIASSSSNREAIATVVESIAAGSVGKIESSCLELVRARIVSTDDEYLDGSLTSASDPAQFVIVCKSQLSDSRNAICAVARVSSGGGGGTTDSAVVCYDAVVNSSTKYLTLKFKEIEFLT